MSYSDKSWRKEALAHCLKLLKTAGQEYALHAADKAERESGGVLSGLGAKVRELIASRTHLQEPADA